jgi:hypothetical protein
MGPSERVKLQLFQVFIKNTGPDLEINCAHLKSFASRYAIRTLKGDPASL